VGLTSPLHNKGSDENIRDKPRIRQHRMEVITVSRNVRTLFMEKDLWVD
jgi:hypothetical protein